MRWPASSAPWRSRATMPRPGTTAAGPWPRAAIPWRAPVRCRMRWTVSTAPWRSPPTMPRRSTTRACCSSSWGGARRPPPVSTPPSARPRGRCAATITWSRRAGCSRPIRTWRPCRRWPARLTGSASRTASSWISPSARPWTTPATSPRPSACWPRGTPCGGRRSATTRRRRCNSWRPSRPPSPRG